MEKKIKLTEEQKEILRAVKTHSKVKIKAYAGAGKTTTLLQILKDNPQKNFLIVAFNKSVQKEIQKKVKKENLKNALVYTLHSLAYTVVFQNKLYSKGKIGGIETKKQIILQSIREELGRDLAEIWEVDYVNSELLNFVYKMFNVLLSSVYSPNPDFAIAQLYEALWYDYEARLFFNTLKGRYVKEMEKQLKYKNLNWAEIFERKTMQSINLLWEATKNAIEEDGLLNKEEKEILGLDDILLGEKEDFEFTQQNVNGINRKKIKYSPEAVIKYLHYALYTGKLKLTKLNRKKIDYVLVDEAQDVNGVQIGLLNVLQKQWKIVVVGDPHQNIYNWRSSVNIFAYYKDKNWIELPLSISFRFENPQIVNFANAIIQKIKGEKTPLRMFYEKEIEKAKDVAILTRSNAVMFQYLNDLRIVEETYKEGGNWERKIENMFANLPYTGDINEFMSLVLGNISQNFDKYEEIKLKILRKQRELLQPIVNAYYVLKYLKKGSKKAIEQLANIYPPFVIEELERNPVWISDIDMFKTYLEEQLMDREMLMALNIVERLGSKNVWDTVKWIKAKIEKGTFLDVEKTQKRANKDVAIYLSTIHTSKGLEWDYVVLGEDVRTITEEIYSFMVVEGKKIVYEEFMGILQNIRDMDKRVNPLLDEINLKYVAITRAKKGLLFGEDEFYRELMELFAEDRPEKYLFTQIQELKKQKEMEDLDLFGF
jgi:superfamily I DNA/RNA helicase